MLPALGFSHFALIALSLAAATACTASPSQPAHTPSRDSLSGNSQDPQPATPGFAAKPQLAEPSGKTQDPQKQDPQGPLSTILGKRSLTEVSAAFGNISMETFRDAFTQEHESEKSKETKVNSLDGFNFGTGIGANFDLHHGERVKTATIRDGVVRVEEEANAQLGFVLETHYFWTCDSAKLIGIGPFVAVRTGNNNDIIDQAGLGIMAGFRRNNTDTNSFNLGVGVMVDPNAQVLADGFAPNQAPPAGATTVSTKTEERFSLGIVFSYTF